MLCIMWHHSLSSQLRCTLSVWMTQPNNVAQRIVLHHLISCIKTKHCIVYHDILSNLSYYTTLLYISSYPPFCHSVKCCSASIFRWCCSRIRGAEVLTGLRTGRITWAFAAARLSHWLAQSGWPFVSSIAQPVWAQRGGKMAKKIAKRRGQMGGVLVP